MSFGKMAYNRWMDKSLQLVCTANGKMAYVGEHSMLDAAPVIPLIKRIIKTTYHRLSSKQAQEENELTIVSWKQMMTMVELSMSLKSVGSRT